MKFKIFDKVRYQEAGKWILSGIVLEVLSDKYLVIDTIIGGSYKVPVSGVRFMPDPKGHFMLKGEISEEEIEAFRAAWRNQMTGNSYKTPIIEGEKVLFLDIDGVLNTPAAECGYHFAKAFDLEKRYKDDEGITRRLTHSWCPASLYNLYRIVEKTDCKIVVSSVWRLGADLKDMKGWFNCDLLRDAVIDKTPALYVTDGERLSCGHQPTRQLQRGEEIATWVRSRPEVTNIAVVDDDSDMDAVRSDFFQVDGFIGLDWRTADKIIEHLNKE